MSIIETQCNLVAAELEKRNVERRLAFDPTILYMIAQIIIAIINLYMRCRETPKEAHASMKTLNILERWHLRRVIRNNIDDQEMWDHVGAKLFDSLAAVGSQISEEDVAKVFEEVKGQGQS